MIESDRSIVKSINGEGELRHAVWEGQESTYFLSIRVFEYLIKRDESKKDQGVEVLLLSDSSDKGTEALGLLVSDSIYTGFTGRARLVFTPSSVTHVQIYKKVVYRCSTIMLGQSRSRIEAGVSTDVVSTKAESKDALSVVRDMLSSGVKAKDIVSILKGSISKKNAEVVAHKQKRVVTKYEEHQSSEEEDSSAEDDIVYDDSVEEDQQSSEKDLETNRKKSKGQRILDSPGATSSKDSSSNKVKVKYPPKR
jgi:hypothetical protein